MIGLGTQSSYGTARDFMARHGITFRMFWDSGFDSWDGFGVWGQPTSILVSRSGMVMQRRQGAMNDQQRADTARLAREQG